MKNNKTTNSSRRLFMKKVAYVTPAVIALGVLGAPTNANASYIQVGQLKNYSNDRIADVFQDNGSEELRKTYENDTYVQNDTKFFTTNNSFMNWLLSFFS